MEKKNPLNEVLQESMAKVREMVDTNTIVGQPIQIGQILIQNQRDRDILYFNFILAQQEQYQVQRALKVLHPLPVVHHLFQLEYRAVHPYTSPSEK